MTGKSVFRPRSGLSAPAYRFGGRLVGPDLRRCPCGRNGAAEVKLEQDVNDPTSFSSGRILVSFKNP